MRAIGKSPRVVARLHEQATSDVAKLVERLGTLSPATLPLDGSFESLDRIEKLLRLHNEMRAPVASYIGQTLIAHAGGRWEDPRANSEDGEHPLITKLDEVPRARFYPTEVAGQALQLERTVIRDAVEHHDIAMRRRVLANHLAYLDERMSVLRSDVSRLAGRELVTLDDLERAAIALQTIDPYERREIFEHMVLFVGEFVRARTGGEWTVDTNDKGVDLGEFRANGYLPAGVLRNVGADAPGLLARGMGSAIAARDGS